MGTFNFLEAALDVAKGRDSVWKQHARGILETHKGLHVDDVVAKLCLKVAALSRVTGVSPEQLAAETVAFNAALYAWGRDGFPHFSLTPDFFHAVTNTDFGDPTDEPLYMPFDSFTVSFPPTPEFLGASKMFVYKLPRVMVVPLVEGAESTFQVEWGLYRVTLLTADPVFTQWTVGMTRRQLVDEESVLSRTPADPGARPAEAHETPVLAKVRALLANVLSYVENAGPLPTVPRAKGAAPVAVELTHPQQRIYDVGRTVKLDARIRDAMTHSGGNKAAWQVAQRFIVRGHWRNQAHGEGRMLRKRLWIEPHWKGGENVKEVLERNYEVSL